MILKLLEDNILNEKIVKVGNKWQVQSEKGRNMGTYDTKAEAEERLKQVHYFKYVNESSRSTLISKSKGADKYANGKGSRWTQKSKCSVASTVKDYNKIDMNTFWKEDKLTFDVKVKGETNDYVVTISFKDILPKIQRKIHDNKQLLEFKCIYDALIQAINSGDVKISCTCLHPDTKIKLLDGTTPTVKEMCERFEAGEKLYVYSTDKNGDFKPGEVEKVWMTKITKEFIKVTLDNGKEILTTPEHPYMLRNGSYILAQDLKEGTSLMPMYFNQTNGYETIKLNTKVRGWYATYKLVANYFKSAEIKDAELRSKPEDNMNYSVAIHHKDFNKKNNCPENLQIMTAKEHWIYHANLSGKNRPVTEKMIQVGRDNAIKRNADPTEKMLECRKVWQEKGKLRNYDLDRKEQQSKILTNTLNNYYANFTEEDWKAKSEKCSKETKERWKNGSFNTEKFHTARVREGKKLFNNPIHQLNMRKAKMKKVLQYLLDNNLELTEDNYNKYRNKASKVEKVFNSFNDMIKEFNLNHKVIKVEKIILNETPVYDIKVKKWENFVVDAGVVLHNCPDYKYRLKYWNSENGDEAGSRETRKSDKTNPNNTKGPACKHILAVLNNVEWLNKIASVINNYANYCKDNMQYNYSKYIFPKLYGMPYNKAVQMVLDDYDENGELKDTLKSDEETINLSNALGRERGKFKKGSNKNPAAKKKEESLQESYSLNETIDLNESFDDEPDLEKHYHDHCIKGKFDTTILFTQYKDKEEYKRGAEDFLVQATKGGVKILDGKGDKRPVVCYFKYRQERDHTYTYAQYFISPKDKKRKITTYMRYNQFEFAGIQFRYTAADLPERENQLTDFNVIMTDKEIDTIKAEEKELIKDKEMKADDKTY